MTTARAGYQPVRLAGATPERITWIWEERLTAGKVVLLDGGPGGGKSTITLDLATRISTSTTMPDETPPAPG